VKAVIDVDVDDLFVARHDRSTKTGESRADTDDHVGFLVVLSGRSAGAGSPVHPEVERVRPRDRRLAVERREHTGLERFRKLYKSVVGVSKTDTTTCDDDRAFGID
jgi:hypothetical protein